MNIAQAGFLNILAVNIDVAIVREVFTCLAGERNN